MGDKHGKDIFLNLLEKNTKKWKMAAKGIVIGLFSGLIVSLYRIMIEEGTKIYTFLKK